MFVLDIGLGLEAVVGVAKLAFRRHRVARREEDIVVEPCSFEVGRLGLVNHQPCTLREDMPKELNLEAYSFSFLDPLKMVVAVATFGFEYSLVTLQLVLKLMRNLTKGDFP